MLSDQFVHYPVLNNISAAPNFGKVCIDKGGRFEPLKNPKDWYSHGKAHVNFMRYISLGNVYTFMHIMKRVGVEERGV